MIDGLLNVLNGLTDVEFVEEAWSHSPTQKYGVITLDGQKALKTGKSMISEKMLRGYVDVFEKKPKSLNTPNSVEAALSRLGIYFNLESVQFEEETGYVHWEWRWLDTLNVCSAMLYVVKFVTHDDETTQIIRLGQTPTAPSTPNYIEDGITYRFYQWTPNVTAANKNVTYTAKYGMLFAEQNTSNGLRIRTASRQKVTDEQIENAVAWYQSGERVSVLVNDSAYKAGKVDENGVTYINGTRFTEWDKA